MTQEPFEIEAMVHSLKDKAKVKIIEHKDNNHVIAEYDGKRCTAIFNPFVELYYVDNVYGILNEHEMSNDMH